jgi:hypothetical protein
VKISGRLAPKAAVWFGAINYGVRLDAHHVADAKERVVVEPRTGIGPVESFRASAAGGSQIFLEVETRTGLLAKPLEMSGIHIFRYAARSAADLAAG